MTNANFSKYSKVSPTRPPTRVQTDAPDTGGSQNETENSTKAPTGAPRTIIGLTKRPLVPKIYA